MVNIVKIMNVSVCCESALQREVGAWRNLPVIAVRFQPIRAENGLIGSLFCRGTRDHMFTRTWYFIQDDETH